MSKVETQDKTKMIIQRTLDAFFSVGDGVKDGISIPVDSVDTEILTDAIHQALEKEKQNENPNKFDQ